MYRLEIFKPILLYTLATVSILVPNLLAVAFYTLAERKVRSAQQRRIGPNVVGLYGLIQPIADGVKLVLKETVYPMLSDNFIFISAPIITFSLSMITWSIVPYETGAVYWDFKYSLLFYLALAAIGSYGIMFAGWSSNSSYAFLGGLRSAAQIISYEVARGTIVLCIALCCNSVNLADIVLIQKSGWFVLTFFPLFILYVIVILAETNRAPFDLPEAEAELVSGYNVEYAAAIFASFFLAEYTSMLMGSVLGVILFLGGWLGPIYIIFINNNVFWFAIKISIFAFLFIWVRASLPRYRYDHLRVFCWKFLLPIALIYFIFISIYLFIFGGAQGTETILIASLQNWPTPFK